MRHLVELEAHRNCRLWGRKYQPGDVIEVEYIGLGSLTDWINEHLGEGGPWGWGRFKSNSIRRSFRLIEDR